MENSMQTLLYKIGELQKKQIIKQTEVKRRGEDFNVFSVLGLWSEEVRLHSAMLAELLNPEGSHGCNENFLRLFIQDVVEIKLSNDMDELSKAFTTAEYHIGCINEEGTEGGRIDILIEMPQNTGIPSLIIENKIYAEDQPNQLRRYYNFGVTKYQSPDNFKILYLTLYGSSASTTSTGEGEPFDYIKCSYIHHIRKWLEHCAAIAYDKPKVRETIIQYNHLLTQITAYYMNEKNPIVEEIASKEDYLKNAILICSYQNDIIKKAISGPITKALEHIREMAEQKTQLNIKFKSNEFTERSGKLDWGFSYFITNNQKTVKVVYIFDKWGLIDLYYGISKDNISSGVPITPIFNNPSDNWPWGWEWAPDKYNTWNGENLYHIIDELTSQPYESSEFCKNILNVIVKSSKLLNN